MKFGRVNIKITTLKCDRIQREFQGSCYSQMQHTAYTVGDDDDEIVAMENNDMDNSMIGRQLQTNMTEMNLNDNQISNITLATNINV